MYRPPNKQHRSHPRVAFWCPSAQRSGSSHCFSPCEFNPRNACFEELKFRYWSDLFIIRIHSAMFKEFVPKSRKTKLLSSKLSQIYLAIPFPDGLSILVNLFQYFQEPP
jgi:hypothetical protein